MIAFQGTLIETSLVYNHRSYSEQLNKKNTKMCNYEISCLIYEKINGSYKY